MSLLPIALQNLHKAPADWSVDRYARHALRVAVAVWIVMTASCIAAGLIRGKPARYFAEFKPYTFYTTFALGICAVVCAQCSRLTQDDAQRFWKLVCIGFAFLAIDELCLVHENIDRLTHCIVGKNRDNHITDHLDDLIVLGYGLVGLVLAYQHRWVILRLRFFRRGGTIAMILFAVMVLLDAGDGFGIVRIPARIAEEGLKGLAITAFFWTFVVCRQELREVNASPSSERLGAPLLHGGAIGVEPSRSE
jgi:hypothetical protein